MKIIPQALLQRRLDVLWSRLSVPREGQMGAHWRAIPGERPGVREHI